MSKDKTTTNGNDNDGACVWLTRDVSHGVMAKLVDVWSKMPTRAASGDRDMRCVAFSDAAKPDEEATLVERLTSVQCLDRYNIVPSGDECIYIDNPRVN